jgi:hypothetical protein
LDLHAGTGCFVSEFVNVDGVGVYHPDVLEMATLTIDLSGSAVVTGSQSYTINDTDVQSVLDWATAAFATQLSTAPTNQQIMLAWVQNWIDGTKTAVQRFDTPAPVVPAQIDFIG